MRGSPDAIAPRLPQYVARGFPDVKRPSSNALRQILYLGTPLYADPSANATKIAYLLAGTSVTVLSSKSPAFLYVRTADGGTGYVRTASVSKRGT